MDSQDSQWLDSQDSQYVLAIYLEAENALLKAEHARLAAAARAVKVVAEGPVVSVKDHPRPWADSVERQELWAEQARLRKEELKKSIEQERKKQAEDELKEAALPALSKASRKSMTRKHTVHVSQEERLERLTSPTRVRQASPPPRRVQEGLPEDVPPQAAGLSKAALGPRQLRERALKEGCVVAEIKAARDTDEPKHALTALIVSNQLRRRAAQEGCSAEEVGAAWSTVERRDATLSELVASNQLRQEAHRLGYSPEEIKAAWVSSGRRDIALNQLITEYSIWRTTRLPKYVESLDVASLVAHAKQTRSIGRDILEDARDEEAPRHALSRLLLEAPDFVAEQRHALREETERQKQEKERQRLVATQKCRLCEQPMPSDYNSQGPSSRVCPNKVRSPRLIRPLLSCVQYDITKTYPPGWSATGALWRQMFRIGS